MEIGRNFRGLGEAGVETAQARLGVGEGAILWTTQILTALSTPGVLLKDSFLDILRSRIQGGYASRIKCLMI